MKKGFTLIELLAIISILSIIALISIPVVNNVLEESQQKITLESARELVKQATTTTVDNGNTVPYQYKIEDNTLNYRGGDFTKGLIVVTSGNHSFVENLSTPKYCINGSLDNLEIEKGSCTNSSYTDYVSTEQIMNDFSNSSMLTFDELKGDFYLKGNVTNNYVSFSGIVWRILSFKDGMMRLVSQSPISAGGSKNYQASLDYLKNTFYNNLENKEYVVSSEYSTGLVSSTADLNNVIASEETMNENYKVALLTVGDYMRATQSGTNFITNGSTWLLNKKNESTGYYLSTSTINTLSISSTMTFRPVITLQSYVAFSGIGTSSDPYKVK